jgi:hypothetical protein
MVVLLVQFLQHESLGTGHVAILGADAKRRRGACDLSSKNLQKSDLFCEFPGVVYPEEEASGKRSQWFREIL